MLYDPFRRLRCDSKTGDPYEYIKSRLFRLLDYGYTLEAFLKSVNDWFGGLYQKGFYLEDMDMLKDNEGILFNFVAGKSTDTVIDNVWLQLQRGGDVYLVYSTTIETNEPGREAAEEIKECIKKLENDISDIEDYVCDCPDTCNLEVNTYTDDPEEYMVNINVNIYLSDWRCIPDIELIDKLFKKIVTCYEKSR